MAEQHTRAGAFRGLLGAMAAYLFSEMQELDAKCERLKTENEALRARIAELEPLAALTQLRAGQATPAPGPAGSPQEG